ncbi:MAG: sel1 repeat family protein [Chitinophagaceae bacterium]|nr:sel1 repeat family protein [Chitinophagaceae bacterium]
MKRKIFNPHAESEEVLVNNFVVRLKEFEMLFEDIRTSKMKHPEQHYLIQGLRGMGKTTLLIRLKIQVQRNPALNTWLIPVFLNEETYNIRSLSNLWERIAEYLDDLEFSDEKLTAQFEKLEGEKDYQNLCFKTLLNFLHKHGKKILLLFDNIGESFFEKLSEKETHRFREILMTCADLRIIGASSVTLDYTYDYSKPFFDFFQTIHLGELSADETMLMLEKLQDSLPEVERVNLKSQAGKIETLRILTGGVTRTIILLSEILLYDSAGNAIQNLEEILDRITPLYKHRMDNLKPQQQQIMDVIAKGWDAISTKEIAAKVKDDGESSSSKHISAQLAQLEKNDLIIKKETSTKNHLYQVRERFFNIWYLMRLGSRQDKRRVLWLTRFLEEWYGKEGLQPFVEGFIEKVKSGKYNPYSAYVMSEALVQDKHIEYKLQHELLEETKKLLPDELKKNLSISASDTLIQFEILRKQGKYNECLKILNEISPQNDSLNFYYGFVYSELKNLKSAETFYLMAIEKGDSGAMFNLAILYQTEFKDFISAERYYLMAIDKEHSGAMFNLAILYEREFKDFKSAGRYYIMAIKKGYSDAMFNLAHLYETEFKDFKSAEKYYLVLIEKEHSNSMYNLALLYQTKFKDFKSAERYYMMAIEKGHPGAMFNLALLYQIEFKDFKSAERFYLMAIDKEHSGAMFNLAVLYERELKDFKSAEKYYLMAIENGNSSAMNNLALRYKIDLKDFESAKRYFLMAIEKGHSGAMNNLANLYQIEFKDFKSAERFYLMAIEKGHSGAMNNLGLLYEIKFKDFKSAEKYYLMAIEKGESEAIYNLCLNYFEQKIGKIKAWNLCKHLISQSSTALHKLTVIFIAIWNNKVEEAYKLLNLILAESGLIEEFYDDIGFNLQLFLAKKQEHKLFEIFNTNPHNLKERFKPIYYALMKRLKKEYPNEYLKMGKELEKPVEDILKYVEQLAKDYA